MWLHSVNTHSDIETFLLDGITFWLTSASGQFISDSTVDPPLHKAFRTQQLIGWEALLYGFVASELIVYQQKHYTDIGLRKTGKRWGVQLITHMWSIIQAHWIHRNHALHETEALARLSGVDDLILAVKKEYELGLGKLPSVYTSYFIPPLAFILDKPTAYIKRWFLVVRSGRESCTIDMNIDIFSTDCALRAWVGLRAL